MRALAIPLSIFCLIPMQLRSAELIVGTSRIEDQKAVIATVEPIHQLVARTRIGGTIVALAAHEGDRVAAGAVLATVVDQKLELQVKALDQRISSQQAQRDLARADFERIQELQRRGVSAQAQLDQAHTQLDVGERTLAAMQADRNVLMQQMAEGAVLAPGAGRVLSVPVSEGRVVLPGESVAILAEDRYILRLSLPERHAQIMRPGDKVKIGARGLQESDGEQRREGLVRLVYPEIQGGRVIADVEVEGLGDYFIGERTRVYVTTGFRNVILVPVAAIYQRAGARFVRLRDGTEVVVQPGETRAGNVEILAGLRNGDVVRVP